MWRHLRAAMLVTAGGWPETKVFEPEGRLFVAGTIHAGGTRPARSETMPGKSWEEMSADEKRLHQRYGQEIPDLRHQLGSLAVRIHHLEQERAARNICLKRG